MREHLERLFSARFIQWDEPDENGDVTFSCYVGGEFLIAPTLALMFSALQDRVGFAPIRLAA